MRTARPLYSILAAENLRLQKIDHLAGANRKRIDENRRKIVRGHQMASNYDFLTEGNLINSIIAQHQWWCFGYREYTPSSKETGEAEGEG